MMCLKVTPGQAFQESFKEALTNLTSEAQGDMGLYWRVKIARLRGSEHPLNRQCLLNFIDLEREKLYILQN